MKKPLKLCIFKNKENVEGGILEPIMLNETTDKAEFKILNTLKIQNDDKPSPVGYTEFMLSPPHEKLPYGAMHGRVQGDDVP